MRAELYVRRGERVDQEDTAEILEGTPVYLHVTNGPAVVDCVVITLDNVAVYIDNSLYGRPLATHDYVRMSDIRPVS